jgi:hypothetical protein
LDVRIPDGLSGPVAPQTDGGIMSSNPSEDFLREMNDRSCGSPAFIPVSVFVMIICEGFTYIIWYKIHTPYHNIFQALAIR